MIFNRYEWRLVLRVLFLFIAVTATVLAGKKRWRASVRCDNGTVGGVFST
jgi:hypothetical protein